MATGIDPATVRLREVVSRTVLPGWIWSPDGGEVWMLDVGEDGLPYTRAVNIETGDERVVTHVWGRFSRSRRYVLTAGQQREAIRVHDRSTLATWEVPRIGSRPLPNPAETHLAGSLWHPGAQQPFTTPADMVRTRLDGGDRRVVARVLGGVAGWRADGMLLVIGRDGLDAATTLRVVGPVGELEHEWPLGRRVRTAQVSPSGRHMTFAVVLDERGRNGQFAIDLFSGRRWTLPSRMSLRWMPDETGLLAVSLRRSPGRPFRLWRLAAPKFHLEGALTDPDLHNVDMEVLDWRISPAGTALAFRTPREAHLHVVTWERTQAG